MDVNTSFSFNQSSLQDYLDCSHRFQLRYVFDQPWPAVDPVLCRDAAHDAL